MDARHKVASLLACCLILMPGASQIAPAWAMAAGTRAATMHTVVLRHETRVSLARVQAGYICLAIRGYSCLPLRWHGTRSVDIVDRDGVLFSNGKARLLDLRGMSAPKAITAITTHSSTIETIALGGNEKPGVVAALNRLSKKRLAVAYAVGWPGCSRSPQWRRVYRRVRALSIRRGYAIICPNLFPKLEHLIISPSVHFEKLEELRRLPRFPRLRSLSLSFDSKGDRLARILSQLRHLEILELLTSRISSKAFLRVVALPKLRSLHLYGPRLEKGSCKHLKRARDLTALEIRGGNCTSSQLLDFIKSAKGLRGLSLDPVPKSTAILRAIKAHTSLKHLALRRARLGPSALLSLKRLKNLERLTISRVPGPAANLSVLASLPKLEHLRLRGFKALGDLRWLQRSRKLVSLQLARVRPESINHLDLRPLKHLKWLRLSLPKTAKKPLRIRALPPQLRHFSLTRGRISNATLASLSRLRKLESLAFYTVPLSRSQTRLLSCFPELDAIVLFHAGIDSAGLLALSRAPKLDSLSIYGSNVPFTALSRFLRRTTIRNLWFLGNKLTRAQRARLRTLRKDIRLELEFRIE